jgi:putative secretion ATPase (PEP-CTERM system associated)
MYEPFYGFREKPFQITPNPAFLYRSSKHDKALTYLEYGLSENVGFILLTGEVGSGKTTLVQYIVSRLEADIEAAVIFNTNVSAEELLALILEEFEIRRPPSGKADLLLALNNFLVDRYSHRQRVLLIIDEGQNLSDQALEEVRMLSNLQSDDRSLLQIMLVGQPELVGRLKQPSLRQFSQRIAASYHLTGLDREETGKYITHRLRQAGGRAELFTPAAVDLIYTLSGGIPRAINLVCQAALVYGFAEGSKKIGQDTIHQISKDNLCVGVDATGPGAASPPAAPPAGPPAHSNGNGFERKLGLLEAGLQDLKELVTVQLQDLERQSQKLREDQFRQLIELLKQERQQKEALVCELARLEAENKGLKRVGLLLKQKLQRMPAAVPRKPIL